MTFAKGLSFIFRSPSVDLIFFKPAGVKPKSLQYTSAVLFISSHSIKAGFFILFVSP